MQKTIHLKRNCNFLAYQTSVFFNPCFEMLSLQCSALVIFVKKSKLQSMDNALYSTQISTCNLQHVLVHVCSMEHSVMLQNDSKIGSSNCTPGLRLILFAKGYSFYYLLLLLPPRSCLILLSKHKIHFLRHKKRAHLCVCLWGAATKSNWNNNQVSSSSSLYAREGIQFFSHFSVFSQEI